MAHPVGGTLGRLWRDNSGRQHIDFKRRQKFGRGQYDRRGRHGNFGGGATITQQGCTSTSEGGTVTSERDTWLQRSTRPHDGLRGCKTVSECGIYGFIGGTIMKGGPWLLRAARRFGGRYFRFEGRHNPVRWLYDFRGRHCDLRGRHHDYRGRLYDSEGGTITLEGGNIISEGGRMTLEGGTMIS